MFEIGAARILRRQVHFDAERTLNVRQGLLIGPGKRIAPVLRDIPAPVNECAGRNQCGGRRDKAEGFERPADGYFQKPDSSLQVSALLAATEGNNSVGAGGTDITEESGLAVFGNWMQVSPGETRVAKISYRLPFQASDSLTQPSTGWEKFKDALGAFAPLARHRLIVRRQAGTQDRTFGTTIRLPAGWTVQSRLPNDLVMNGGGVSWTGPLDHDLYLGLVAAVER